MPIYPPMGILRVQEILTQDEVETLYYTSSDREEWIKWLYKKGYRLVKLEEEEDERKTEADVD
jgi:hypothetical protein